MSNQPPPILSEKHDADAIKVLDAILTSPASEIKQRVDEAKAYFGARIAGDLRPRILAFEQTTSEQQARLGELEKLAKGKK